MNTFYLFAFFLSNFTSKLISQKQAVVSTITPLSASFHPFLEGINEQWSRLLKVIPAFFLGLLILIITWFSVKKAMQYSYQIFSSHLKQNSLLQKVLSWCVGILVFLMGLYTFFNVMGLTDMALTLVGGTGLLGIILGLAFKDITENLLASIFLSVNNPFQKGDLIELEGVIGYVQQLTIRSTILINFSGNSIQIPNATVYKSKICNYSINPNRREDFALKIGVTCSLATMQTIALKILQNHKAVLKEPKPLVLVDSLDKENVTLKIYFWLNGKTHSFLKLRSSLICLIKKAFEEEQLNPKENFLEKEIKEDFTIEITSQQVDFLKPFDQGNDLLNR